MLQLPDVTLICIDTVCHDLARLAIEDCVRHCAFADVITFFDEPITSKEEYSRFLWDDAWKAVKTSHFLVCQWDSWIIDPGMWRDEFLGFDYIGAPWWHQDRYNVGNGGFSLRSTRLAKHVAENAARYPRFDPEDVALCRRHRFGLERDGFRWAPFDTALDFSFECVRKSLDQRHFGFHAFRNWPFVLSRERLDERLALLNDYIMRDNQFGLLMQNLDTLHQMGREVGYIH